MFALLYLALGSNRMFACDVLYYFSMFAQCLLLVFVLPYHALGSNTIFTCEVFLPFFNVCIMFACEVYFALPCCWF